MTIILYRDDFLFELFPVAENNSEQLEDFLKRFYTVGPFQPKIEILDDLIKIEIDTTRISEDTASYQRLVELSEKGEYEKAKLLAQELIDNSPNVSEYHRILGQILSEEGDQEEAINCLIDALRWNPKNERALLMMGNIFAKYKGDIDTALTYYNQVLVVNPNDEIALTNIGANLVQLGKTMQGLKYFEKALEVNPDFPNTHHGLGLISRMDGDYEGAFKHALNAVKVSKKKDELYSRSIELAIQSARQLIENIDADKIINDFGKQLEKASGKPVQIEINDTIPTAAKIEFAENYNRDFHLVKYKSIYPAVAHLVMHELMHLDLVLAARKTGRNALFISNESMRAKFFNSLKTFSKKLGSNDIPEENITNYLQALYDGINSQIFNTPIDLFIEDRIYADYPELRPFQFLSLLGLIREGIEATTKASIVKNSPSGILSKSKILNLVNASHFKVLYGIDLIAEHNPTKLEINRAKEFYREFEEYRTDKAPGEEYELIQHWGEDLDLDSYFELVPEEEHRKKTLDQVLSEIESDPYGLNTPDPSKERKMKKFLENHSDKEINSAVVMYMVSALEYFNPMPQFRVKELAFEFATLGMAGIDPKKKGYSVPSIKNASFSGYKALAYYYVSWAVGIPEMLAQLQMPFDKEFELAKQLMNI